MALCAIFAACCAQLRALLRPSGARSYGRTERAPYPPQRGLRQLRLVQRPVDLMHGPAGEGLALRRCARGAALQQRIVKLGRRPVGRLGEDCSGISIHTSGKPHDSYRVSLPPRTSVVLSTRATGTIENYLCWAVNPEQVRQAWSVQIRVRRPTGAADQRGVP